MAANWEAFRARTPEAWAWPSVPVPHTLVAPNPFAGPAYRLTAEGEVISAPRRQLSTESIPAAQVETLVDSDNELTPEDVTGLIRVISKMLDVNAMWVIEVTKFLETDDDDENTGNHGIASRRHEKLAEWHEEATMLLTALQAKAHGQHGMPDDKMVVSYHMIGYQHQRLTQTRFEYCVVPAPEPAPEPAPSAAAAAGAEVDSEADEASTHVREDPATQEYNEDCTPKTPPAPVESLLSDTDADIPEGPLHPAEETFLRPLSTPPRSRRRRSPASPPRYEFVFGRDDDVVPVAPTAVQVIRRRRLRRKTAQDETWHGCDLD